MSLIHMSFGGPVRHLVAQKPYRFEDHPHCGPIVLDMHDEPLAKQPGELDLFWVHVNAWYAQGKKTKRVGDQVWCVYETEMQVSRRLHAEARKATQPKDQP